MNNPSLSRSDAEALGKSRGCSDSVLFLGLRSVNSSYGKYDDTICLITPEAYVEFVANTLPSSWVPGIAKLMPGDYIYEQGLHGVHHFNDLPPQIAAEVKQWLYANIGQDHAPISSYILPYWAFRQAGPVTILRDGSNTPETETNPADYPFIDLHRGGSYTTSSAGCQTFRPDHWPDARKLGYEAMNKYNQSRITYSLHQL
jgi:hypothetical protein